MANETAIGWTDLTWNPTHGCSIVSTECKNCYAAVLSNRYGQTPLPWTPANAAQNVLLKPHKLREPLSGAKAWQGLGAAAAAAGKTDGKLVFVNSMSDLFHEQVPFEFVDEVFDTMAAAPQHTFQVLTKRPDRMLDYMLMAEARAMSGGDVMPGAPWSSPMGAPLYDWPLPNVWLGVSVGLRHFVGRADLLRQTPAAVRFISAEPLLGPLVGHWVEETGDYGTSYGWEHVWPDGSTEGAPLDLTGISWLIVGGESGRGHRPMDVQWVRDLRDAAHATRIGDERPDCAFFMKQLGGARAGTALEDLPEDLRIREFPS